MKHAILLCISAAALSAASGLGVFEGQTDIGETPKKGTAEFSDGEYRVTGGGENMWKSTDAFHFVWKKLSGDVSITADVRFVGTSAAGHRKAALMIRQSLDPGSAYADVALHGDGLTSLQYRPTSDVLTQEVRSELNAPLRIRIERRRNQFTLFAGKPGEELNASGPVTVELQDAVYVGLAMCSHDANVLETAVFSNVDVRASSSEASSSGAGSSDPWTSHELIETAALAKEVLSARAPTVLSVAFPVLYRNRHIVHAIEAGPGSKPEGIAKLKQAVAGLPKDADLVIYCGCCPMVKCPNVRPAYRALKEMGFTRVRVLDIPANMHADWFSKDYPAEAGSVAQ